MNNLLNYKGLTGSIHFSAEDRIYYGKIEGIKEVVTFEGSTLEDLKKDFRFAVDEYAGA